MAVYGVSAPAALRELHWHSAQLNTSVGNLAEDVMRSISGRRTAITPDILGALLAGQPLPRAERGIDPGPDRRHRAHPLASALHLVATDHLRPLRDSVESWTWERDGLTHALGTTPTQARHDHQPPTPVTSTDF